MADYDCGFCEIVRKCGAKILLSDFPTFVIRLLCQLSERLDNLIIAVGGGVGGAGLINFAYDEEDITWVGGNATVRTFKLAGTTVATITYSYDIDDNPINIKRVP